MSHDSGSSDKHSELTETTRGDATRSEPPRPEVLGSNAASFANTSSHTAPSNMLKHIENLEKQKERLEVELKNEKTKNEKMSAKTREGMQSALDTLMKKWMDAVETKDEKVKDHFKEGMNKLVQNSAEENGVWQMMVAASALHERQIHDLDKLRAENEEMRKSIDGRFALPESRKRPADEQLDRASVNTESSAGMWDEFARDIGSMY